MEIIETKKGAKVRSFWDFAPLRLSVLFKLSIYFTRYGKCNVSKTPISLPFPS